MFSFITNQMEHGNRVPATRASPSHLPTLPTNSRPGRVAISPPCPLTADRDVPAERGRRRAEPRLCTGGRHRQRPGVPVQTPGLVARLPLPLGLAGLGEATLLHADARPRAATHLGYELRAGPVRTALPALQGGWLTGEDGLSQHR